LEDAFVSKYDAYGNLKWTRQFGTTAVDYAMGVAVCGSAIYVVGWTEGALPGQTFLGGQDGFLCKFDASGNLKWTRQFGTSTFEWPRGVAVCGSSVYVAGDTEGALPGQTHEGGLDAFVCKYDAYGNLKWTRQFGTTGLDVASGVSVSWSGVYVVGWTAGAFPGAINEGNTDAFVCKYDVNGNLKWVRQFGTSPHDWLHAVAVCGSAVYVAGTTGGTLPGQTNAGTWDAFVCKFDASGNLKWTRQFGTTEQDDAFGVAVNGLAVYVVGWALGALPGQTHEGGFDAYVCKFDAYGNLKWTRQFGTTGGEVAMGVSLSWSGVYAAGYTSGAFPSQTSEGDTDAFVCKVAPP
jgi:hypothetical protein